jgi:hypothetical protein
MYLIISNRYLRYSKLSKLYLQCILVNCKWNIFIKVFLVAILKKTSGYLHVIKCKILINFLISSCTYNYFCLPPICHFTIYIDKHKSCRRNFREVFLRVILDWKSEMRSNHNLILKKLVFLATVTFACSRKKKLLLKKNSMILQKCCQRYLGVRSQRWVAKKRERARDDPTKQIFWVDSDKNCRQSQNKRN